MINNLIQAYRAEFYDSSLADLLTVIKSKWKILLIPILMLALTVSLILFSLYHQASLLMYIAIIPEIIFFTIADRYLIKQYRKIIRHESLHLEQLKYFLHKVYPEHSLFTAPQIDSLISRLSEYILMYEPFKSIADKLVSFVKSIVLPVIAFIAGLYSSEMKTLGITTIVGLSISIIVFLAMLYVLWIFISSVLRKIVFRDYEAAITLRDDLRDIQLLYFAQDNNSTRT